MLDSVIICALSKISNTFEIILNYHNYSNLHLLTPTCLTYSSCLQVRHLASYEQQTNATKLRLTHFSFTYKTYIGISPSYSLATNNTDTVSIQHKSKFEIFSLFFQIQYVPTFLSPSIDYISYVLLLF